MRFSPTNTFPSPLKLHPRSPVNGCCGVSSAAAKIRRSTLALKGTDAISLFTAVEKQLGLKLDVRNVYIPSLVIEKVNSRPSRKSPARNRYRRWPSQRARFEAARYIKLADSEQASVQGRRLAQRRHS